MGNLLSSSRRPPTKTTGIEAVVYNQKDINNLKIEGFNDRDHGLVSWKTLFSSERTPTDTLTAGVATCPPKQEAKLSTVAGHLAPHKHAHAEVYFVLRGEGVVNVDMMEHPVEAGSVVFIPGNASHSVWNTSMTEELVWYYCFASDTFDDIKYRFAHDAGPPEMTEKM